MTPNGLAHWRQVTVAALATRIATFARTATETARRPVQRIVRWQSHNKSLYDSTAGLIDALSFRSAEGLHPQSKAKE